MAGELVFNVAKGRFAYYGSLPAANDALKYILLVAAGLVSDATLKDYDDVAAILAGASDEATFTSYARQTATGVVVTVDDTADTVSLDTADPSFSNGSSQAQGKIVLAYDDDTTSGTDANLVPVFADNYALTTPGSGTVSYTVATGGVISAS